MPAARKKTADYETVSSGTPATPRASQVTFDPHVVSYGKLLQIYFAVAHDPTQLNRQGPDTRHAISLGDFPADAAQRQTARGLHRAA